MRRPKLISLLMVLPLFLAAGPGAFAFQQQGGGGSAGVVAYINESAARAFTKPKVAVRQNVCSVGCRRQRPLQPVQRASNLSAQARKLLDAANKFYDDGQFSEAAENFRKAGQLKPNYEAFLGLGESQYQLKQPDEALKSYQQALKLNSKLDDARYNIGVIQYERKSYQEALDSFKAATETPPANADEYYYYGLTLSELKRKDEAIAALREAIKIDSTYYDAYTELGSLYAAVGRQKEAAETLRQAISQRPERGEAYDFLGDVLFNERKLDDAVGAYEQAARLMPQNAEAFNDLADAYYSLVRSADAVRNYRKALALDPDYRKDWGFAIRYGNSLRQIGESMESMQWLKDAFALDPKEDSPLYLMGVAYASSTPPDYPSAIRVLEQAASLNPKRKETYLLLGVAYMNSLPRKPNEALRAARRAQQLAPNDPDTLFNVGLALVVGQMFEPAYDVFKEVVRLKPEHAMARAQLCTVAGYLERYDEGLPQCFKSVELADPSTRNFSRLALANMYAFSKKFDQALAEANALIKEDPKWFYAWQSLGVTYFLMKKWDKSVSSLKEAIRLSPETAELHLQLGTVYSESGSPQAAEQEYVVLLNLNPNYAVQLRSVMDENKDKKKNH